jgi:hypothetical protein
VPERVRTLLDYIVTSYVVVDEQKDIDLNAPATEAGNALASEKTEVAQRERARAAALSEPFRRGLQAAYRMRRSGQQELPLDDRVPDENAMADALIRFLVSFDLAESRTEETEPMHYIYNVRVDWDKLEAIARQLGMDLDAALAARTA